ncbi:MAG: hypothetical protein JKY71_11745 [Alphaproteobacteria bacterium]|nr:hypothetical protein [Alphaproteobacteria bacterium]
MVELFDLDFEDDAVVLAVNYYPPETGAEIKQMQAEQPAEALAMRKQFAASVDEDYTTAYTNRVVAAGKRVNLPVVEMSTGQLLIIGGEAEVASAREELDGFYHMTQYGIEDFSERLKLVGQNFVSDQPRIVLVTPYNDEDVAMLEAMNQNGGIGIEEEHALFTRAIDRLGGMDAVRTSLEEIAASHSLQLLPYEAKDQFAFKGRAGDVEQATAAFKDAGLDTDDLDPQQFIRHLEMMRNGGMNIHTDDDDFGNDDGPLGGTTFH